MRRFLLLMLWSAGALCSPDLKAMGGEPSGAVGAFSAYCLATRDTFFFSEQRTIEAGLKFINVFTTVAGRVSTEMKIYQLTETAPYGPLMLTRVFDSASGIAETSCNLMLKTATVEDVSTDLQSALTLRPVPPDRYPPPMPAARSWLQAGVDQIRVIDLRDLSSKEGHKVGIVVRSWHVP